MFSIHCRKSFFTYPVILTRFIFFLSLVVTSSVTFAHDADYLGLVRTIQTRYLNVSNPAGLAFSSKAKTFLVMDTPGSEKSSAKVSTSIMMITPAEDLMGSVYIADHITDPINMAFDKKRNCLLIFQSITKELIEIEGKSDGYLDPNTITKYDARKFGLRKPQGMAIDSVRGHLFILDSAVPEIVHIKPNSDQNFNDITISHIYLGQLGKSDLRGIAFNPANDHLFVLNFRKQILYELTRTGKIVARRNVSECKLQDPQSMVFAPSGDLTDDSSQMSLYIANRSHAGKRDQKTTSSGDIQTDAVKAKSEEQGYGNIVELSLTQPPVAAATSNASLVQTVNTFQFSPPSPDPSGITYLPSSNRLLISDAEVEETPIFTGDNLFEMSLSGVLLDTLSTTSFSFEPAGITINPVNKHLFISDDVKRKVFELDPGPDGIYNTSDDRVTSFDTKDFGSIDPEGVAYDSLQGALFIIDGLNAEIYRITPGNNGVFDGVFSPGDDQMTHFDTASIGITDPEGIEYNADNDHLYIVGKPSTLLVEMTTTGILRRMFDISAAKARKLAGLGLAPGSLDPNVMNLYIVDRGVDNAQDPNDGEVYEFLLSPITPNNQVPMVNAGQDQTITLPANATLNDTVSDDGLPNPPGTVTTIWTKVSGPGAVTFANAGAVNKIASFSVAGTYKLRLTADDGELINSDEVTIVVRGTGNEVYADIRVAASSDDAEERDSGNMILTSTDLEMVHDSGFQTVGMRFNGVNIPKEAIILNAYIQFKVDTRTSEATSLSIQAEDTDNAAPFTSTQGNISSRSRTTAAVSWSPVAWTIRGEAGPNQRTPNISAVIQEIVDRPGWSSDNSMVIIITGTGKRVAESYEGDPNGAPLLHIVCTVGQTNQPLAVDAGPIQTDYLIDKRRSGRVQ